MKRLLLVAVVLALPVPALAGPVDGACMRSDRGGNRGLCGCIQQVADMTLSRSDQRRAAGFFKNPDEAQKVRQSDRASDEAFWLRYKNFAATAEAYCGG
ncbi:hypothetical protein CCR83_14680 [Rhodobacter veldkampii DSM 11550]|uniref:Arginine transporter n=1 Tax=Phaeovulum veldkampii DSM 11550 TaxID=1185920 RepID=A0A2T4JC55_9RHOB|nr:hypothetical protein [Phaeovulum veldkampii]MBK5947657.1 hypothetical protein [Phaeovulum veldkampii DSM 11550]NCU20367.1 hypothetical protein [Candidatus Falkowbacteria bacterium]PTE15492.1 hypothetical protein C5F46_13875 [Phaeovulum veldkampii DSM 11550]TDQ56105.1 hypothetical protein EV658_1227 [Phaeovulum veldkampii DSM 11550]